MRDAVECRRIFLSERIFSFDGLINDRTRRGLRLGMNDSSSIVERLLLSFVTTKKKHIDVCLLFFFVFLLFN